MAPPKKEKVVFVNVRVPVSRLRQIKQATKTKGVMNPTEFCRQAIYAATDDVLKTATP